MVLRPPLPLTKQLHSLRSPLAVPFISETHLFAPSLIGEHGVCDWFQKTIVPQVFYWIPQSQRISEPEIKDPYGSADLGQQLLLLLENLKVCNRPRHHPDRITEK